MGINYPICPCIYVYISSLSPLLLNCYQQLPLHQYIHIDSNSNHQSVKMPITELIAPGFKQDDATREAYSSTVLPYLVKIVTGAPGNLSKHAGNILISNSTDVSLAFRPVLGLGMFGPFFISRESGSDIQFV